jgi:hypothetical protein
MSEQKPRIVQVDPQPVDPTTLTTEHGYKPDYPVYPGEEGRVLDPDQAHVMANASKKAEESALSYREDAEKAIERADSELDPQRASDSLSFADDNMRRSEHASQRADNLAVEAAKKYVDNEAAAQQLSDRVSVSKNR